MQGSCGFACKLRKTGDEMSDIGKLLVIAGLAIAGVGLLLWSGVGKSWFGWFGRLPGDIRSGNENFRFYFPLATSLVLSVILTLLLTLISWLTRK